jgi:hypothetical protein
MCPEALPVMKIDNARKNQFCIIIFVYEIKCFIICYIADLQESFSYKNTARAVMRHTKYCKMSAQTI